MSDKTTNYGLEKPLSTDYYDIEIQNGNMETIDTQLKKLDDGKEKLLKNASAKSTLVDADAIPISDSSEFSSTKKITFENLKAAMKAYFDTIYNKYVHPSYTARTAGLYKVTVDDTGHVNSVADIAKSDITVLGIPGQDTVTEVVDNLNSTDSSKALSAKQGKVLNDSIGTILDEVNSLDASKIELNEATAALYGLNRANATVNDVLDKAVNGDNYTVFSINLCDPITQNPVLSGIKFSITQGTTTILVYTTDGIAKRLNLQLPINTVYSLDFDTSTLPIGYNKASTTFSSKLTEVFEKVEIFSLVPITDIAIINTSSTYRIADSFLKLCSKADICIIGGGGNGGSSVRDFCGGGGGAGAYMTNVFNVPIASISNFIAIIGSVASTSSIKLKDDSTYTAAGGSNGGYNGGSGGAGGTGGGGGAYEYKSGRWSGVAGNGGSNGGNGANGDPLAGGSGDGIPKYPFGDTTLPVCCGGGGGGGYNTSFTGGAGGSGGGGNGGDRGQNGSTWGAGGGGGGNSQAGGSGYQGCIMLRFRTV